VVVLGRGFENILVPAYATSTTEATTQPTDVAAEPTVPPTTAERSTSSSPTTVTTLTPAPINDQEEIGFPAPLNPPC
jgi:hypothetical protein